jgi:hypothetical protein
MATARRDLLLDIQAKSQKKWADEKIFEVSAPRDGASMPRPRGPFPPPPRLINQLRSSIEASPPDRFSGTRL